MTSSPRNPEGIMKESKGNINVKTKMEKKFYLTLFLNRKKIYMIKKIG
jgi:hypothetical protein